MKEPWRHVLADGTVIVRVEDAAELAGIPRGTSVAIVDAKTWARRRCRRISHSAAIEIEREYVVLPTLREPLVVVEDDRAALRWLVDHQLTAPPGWPATISLAVKAARFVPPWLFGALVPGRVVIGRRQ